MSKYKFKSRCAQCGKEMKDEYKEVNHIRETNQKHTVFQEYTNIKLNVTSWL